ncbi:YpzG family protein [Bacillus sp. FJAT-49732]|uniref:YpzG family protein n=1 Tax=Lederbergia citrisecunda TaxID=2833583 RepID=A0A942TM02_9BACI|nr:YpzG family protein [Lederbergia citrisecunda]MBS4198442.1 YpzG family protein [Lederbergia citrisecunda]
MANINENSHLNRQLSSFNRGNYSPKKMFNQVNGQTEQSQSQIILENMVVQYQKR